MVDISNKLEQIKKLIDSEFYFTINRPRQYGKTTTLNEISNRLNLSFIGMLRNKYLARETGRDFTFKSVILAGVHDVKSLKLKIRNEEDAKYNSPWNIAVDFNVDMSFSPQEISTMLNEYCLGNSKE